LQSREHSKYLTAFPANIANSLLPLYSGPEVTIRIGSASHEYRLPRALICKQSPYFAAKFEGDFKEGAEQSATLEEIDGVVSTRSFEMLVQWVCLGRIVFRSLPPPAEAIATSIEFMRLADMCGVTGMESMMAEHVKGIIVADAALHKGIYGLRDNNANTYSITTQHVKSAALLPGGHLMRGVLAMAMVEGFFLIDNHRFQKEIQEIPSFAVDLLAAVKVTSKTMTCGEYRIEFKEPLSGEKLRL
jgi:hypothetical protein